MFNASVALEIQRLKKTVAIQITIMVSNGRSSISETNITMIFKRIYDRSKIGEKLAEGFHIDLTKRSVPASIETLLILSYKDANKPGIISNYALPLPNIYCEEALQET